PAAAAAAMQEAPLHPAHPVPFGPRLPGFRDRRLCSPAGDGPFFYGGCIPFVPSPRPSPLGRGSPPFTPSPRSSSPGTPWSSSASSSSGSRVDAAATEHGLRMARLALQYQDFANRYQLCLSHLADAAREAAAIRHDNSGLRLANNGLAGRVAMLAGNQASAVALADQLHRLHLGQMQAQAVPAPPVLPMPMPPASPAEKHAAMPKSISIRSNGYLKMDRNGKHRVTKPVNVGSQQRVFVGVDGAKAEEHQGGGCGGEKGGQVATAAGGLQFEVYSQGMFKTELCNKWEETGACPYGDQCQFAHGIAELRPIIRHPRYKTQVCRMVIGGALCPYGHRCHFRHSITPADYIPLLHP
uniref:C3H1-type domain-containing protein n=1 Tax=Aegilops tauschii subsp. strangulata TaxID=200361 RepID=A0A452ZZJ5_AEGTS